MAGGGSVSFAQKIAARNVLQRAAGNFYSLSNFHFHLTREVESVVDLLPEYFKIKYLYFYFSAVCLFFCHLCTRAIWLSNLLCFILLSMKAALDGTAKVFPHAVVQNGCVWHRQKIKNIKYFQDMLP